MEDSIVKSVIESFKKRSEIGILKYGKTLDRSDLTFLQWIQHAQEELMDGCNYIEKLMTQNQELIEIVRNTPNDSELGRKIRDMVR
jgi:hypothetical protein